MTTTAAAAAYAKPIAPPNPSAKPSMNKQNMNKQNIQQTKVNRRSKPFINWFQRKLGGTVKAKRDTGVRSPLPVRPTNRITSSPLPSAVAPAHINRAQGRLDVLAGARRKTISLNGDNDARDASLFEEDRSSDGESLARGSTWSPRSVADEDASVRPLPPSSPPSPSPSRSSSSYLSDPRTFKSIAASTKPTTLLSIDLHGNGMGHIAEAPVTPISQVTRFTHMRTSSASTTPPNVVSSGASITFSALPPSPQSSRPSSSATAPINSVQAPLHTTHHPRNNPRPSSPPMDNASMLTLASSAYAIPGLRVGMPAGWSSSPPSAVGGGGADSVSQFDGTFADGESRNDNDNDNDNDEEPLDDRDVDASLRALRPRSTRRGSWESEASRWSARIQAGAGTPSLARDRSLWTANSIRTGALSTDHVDGYEKSEHNSPDADEPSTAEDISLSPTSASDAPDVLASDSAPIIVEPVAQHESLHPTNRPEFSIPPVIKESISADTVAQMDGPVVIIPPTPTDENKKLDSE